MSNRKPYKLAKPANKLPMPDRNFRLFSAEGERIDPTQRFYANLIKDGSIVPATKEDDAPAEDAEPVALKPKKNKPQTSD